MLPPTVIIVVALCGFFSFIKAAPTTTMSPDEKFAVDPERLQIAQICMKEAQIEKKVIEKIMTELSETEDTHVIPRDDNRYKQFLACSYRKQGFQDEEGNMMYTNIIQFLSKDYEPADLDILNDCKHMRGENAGELALNSMICIMDNLKGLQEKNKKDDIDTNEV